MENRLECRSEELGHCSWRMDAGNPSPAIYCADISELAAHVEDLGQVLDHSESIRALAYKQDKDRRRFMIARAALRIVLGRYLELAPREIEFGLEANLKPCLKSLSPWHFNVSHTDECVLIAIAKSPLGIDVEYAAKTPAYEHVLDKVFSAAEQVYIRSDGQASKAFYTLWTRKEALLKAGGKGIDDKIMHIPCMDGIHELPGDIPGIGGAWTVITFEPQAQHIASVALAGQVIENPVLYKLDAGSLLQLA